DMQLSDEKSSRLGGSVFNFNEIYECLKEFKQNFTKNRHTQNKAKSVSILENPSNSPSDSSEISQDLLNFGNQSPTSAYSSSNHQETSFAPEFIKYFTTPKRRHRWQMDLNLLTQQEDEKVDLYIYKFKRLQKRVNPKNKLPPTYVVRMFIGGLKSKIAAFMSIAEPKTLDDAIKNARKIEAGKNYKKRKEKDPTNQLIEVLTHKMHQIVTNYKKLTTTLEARVE
ncbi:30972_t:CDS:2, partial [Racocetra persica]